MVYERIRYIQIPTSATTTANTNGNFSILSEVPIDGRITKIQWDKPATLLPQQGGSVLINVSGTAEQLFYTNNVFNNAWAKYPRTYCVDTANTSIVGSIVTEAVCRDSLINIVGSGFGGIGSNIGTFKIFYY